MHTMIQARFADVLRDKFRVVYEEDAHRWNVQRVTLFNPSYHAAMRRARWRSTMRRRVR